VAVTYYKVLNGLRPNIADTSYRYPGVGRWTKRIDGDLEACERGYHLAQNEQVLDWLGPTIYEAEPGDVIVEAGNKIVTDRVRLIRRFDTWNERSARLFAADCAERALNLAGDPDPRSVAAVDVARRFARGEAAAEAAARAAARAAAEAAVEAAAWAARAAERHWQYGRLLDYLEGRAS
jgi:hypothetical protein